MSDRHLYFKVNDRLAIARIGKTGSTTLSAHIARKFYPDRAGGPSSGGAIAVGNATPSPDYFTKDELNLNIRVLVPVRNPIHRFASACAQLDITPTRAVEQLARGTKLCADFHFILAAEFMTPWAEPVRFPEDLDKICDALRVDEIPRMGSAGDRGLVKPEIDHATRIRVGSHYRRDIALIARARSANYSRSLVTCAGSR